MFEVEYRNKENGKVTIERVASHKLARELGKKLASDKGLFVKVRLATSGDLFDLLIYNFEVQQMIVANEQLTQIAAMQLVSEWDYREHNAVCFAWPSGAPRPRFK